MIFVTGTYSILIDSYSYKKLNLGQDYANLTFDLYQAVYHIYYVPIYPTEKHWKVRERETGKEIGTDPEIRTKLNLVALKRKSPILSYLGSIFFGLIVFSILGFFIYLIANDGVQSIQKKIERSAHDQIEVERINTPENNDVYDIKMLKLVAIKNSNGKVLKLEKDWVDICIYQLESFSQDSMYLKLIKEPKYLLSNNAPNTKVSVAKEDLIRISKKYGNIGFIDENRRGGVEKGFKIVFSVGNITRVKEYNQRLKK